MSRISYARPVSYTALLFPAVAVVINSSSSSSSSVSSNDKVNSQQPEPLIPKSSVVSTEPLYAVEIYPHFHTEDSATTLVLSSQRDHPIRLSNVFATTPEATVAQYPFTFLETEAFVTPLGLEFTPDGSHFLAGGHSRLGFFDVSRPYQGPVEVIHTGPRRGKNAVVGTVKGLVSALSLSDEGLLAAGTYSRRIGVYTTGRRDAITSFELAGHEKDDDGETDIGGSGVSQCSWSPCGRYLYVAERNSDGLIIYDIRTGKKLGLMTGRNARTFQRTGFEVVGNHVWAGGADGAIRTWAWPHVHGGVMVPGGEWHVHHDTVTSVSMRSLGDSFVTCSGSRDLLSHISNETELESQSSDGTTSDSSISSSDRESTDQSMSDISESSLSESEASEQKKDYSMKLWTVPVNNEEWQSGDSGCQWCKEKALAG